MPDFSLEQKYQGLIAGVDEAGRGPWAGPVVAAAVVLNPEFCPAGLNDSKKLTKAKREKLFGEIINCADFGIGVVDESIIDEMNILQATKLAMSNAVSQLKSHPKVVLVDGNQKFNALNMEVIPVIKGDSLSCSIAAASILAKVTRDRIMEALHEEFPHYGWGSNAGYGTAVHIEAIEKYGICKYHRRSYAPIKKYLVAG